MISKGNQIVNKKKQKRRVMVQQNTAAMAAQTKKPQKIYVAAILDTKNENVKRLELRCDLQKAPQANPVGFFLQGLENVAPQVEKRVTWLSVSTEFIKLKGIKVGDEDFGKKIGFPQARIVVKEGTVPRQWLDAQGALVSQQPKINPTNSEVLRTHDGREIYRNTFLSIDGENVIMPDNSKVNAEDEYIQHVITTTPGTATNAQEQDLEKLATASQRGSGANYDTGKPATENLSTQQGNTEEPALNQGGNKGRGGR